MNRFGRALFASLLFGCAAPPPAVAPTPPVEVAVVPPEPPPPSPEAHETPPEEHGTPSGIRWTVLRQGTGSFHPGPDDKVVVHYEGWTRDGRRFDSSIDRGAPATFGVSGVIAGWTEVLQRMVIGDHWRVEIPAGLAYGEVAQGSRPAGDLVFEIELLEVLVAPPRPVHSAAPAPGATTTRSGMAYRVLRRGAGRVHPTIVDRVEVHYSGWTTDGALFDSSLMRGKSVTLPLNGVIKGWTEALQLMAEGDVFRVWIPADLAYGTQPRAGAPAGMLIFDIELLRINP